MKIHLRVGSGPACMIVYTGKHYEMTNDPKAVTCVRCRDAARQLEREQEGLIKRNPQATAEEDQL